MAEEDGADWASIRDWLKQKEELLKKDYKRDSFRIQGAGKKTYKSWDRRRIN